MKKLLFLLTVVAFTTFTATAQVKLKVEPAAAFIKKAGSALKSQGTQQTMRAIAPGEECGVFTASATNKEGTKYDAAKEYLIISNDGVTGFAFTMYNTIYKENKYIIVRGLALETGICVDNTSKITVTFDDGEAVTLKNFEDANCKGVVQAIFGKALNNETTLEALRTKKVRSIKLEGVEKTVVKSLSEGNQQQLQGTLKCL
ncbi:MAG: hypothetical protein MUE72_01620 [Chitinophagaceae bacterium]|jgi:hypothetical protein|nr:hypothetical protein [Chitinophagaceae bacterium]